MAGLATWVLALFYLSLALQVVVVCYLLSRKLWLVYPGQSAYFLVNVLQGGLLIAAYRRWGYFDHRTQLAGWGSEILVLVMRAWAIADICRLLLGRYRGVWGLAWRLLLVLGISLIGYSIIAAGRVWNQAVLKANIGLELSTLLILVVLFLFARHYEIVASPAVRALALGFLIYSSFTVVNDKILQQWLVSYIPRWQFFSTLPFIFCVGLWFWAVRQPVAKTAAALSVLPRDVYYALAPEVNLRLRLLNERLLRLWNPEAHRP